MQRKLAGKWRTIILAVAVTAASVLLAGNSSADIGVQARPTFKSPFNCGKTFYANAWRYDSASGRYHEPKYSVDWQSYGSDSVAGETVRATAGGTAYFYSSSGSYGNYVVVTHSGGWKTRYAHLATMVKSSGSKSVSRGTKLGTVGKTGNATGYHLHYEQISSGSVVTSVVEGKTLTLGTKKAVTSTNNCSGGGAERDGVCDAGEFCYYYNSNHAGSVSDHAVSVADYGTSQPSCYEFKGPGNGQGLCIKNDAASVWNRSSRSVRVYYNSNYGGTYQTFEPGDKKNLNSTMKNNNASHRFL